MKGQRVMIWKKGRKRKSDLDAHKEPVSMKQFFPIIATSLFLCDFSSAEVISMKNPYHGRPSVAGPDISSVVKVSGHIEIPIVLIPARWDGTSTVNSLESRYNYRNSTRERYSRFSDRAHSFFQKQ